MLLVTSKTVPEPEHCMRCCVLQGDLNAFQVPCLGRWMTLGHHSGRPMRGATDLVSRAPDGPT